MTQNTLQAYQQKARHTMPCTYAYEAILFLLEKNMATNATISGYMQESVMPRVLRSVETFLTFR